MDFTLGEIESAVTEVARKLLRERVTPATLKATEATEERFDRALWSELAKTELLDVTSQGLLATCALLVEAGAAVAPVPLWPTLVLGAMPIARFGTDEQRARFVRGVASGETVLSAALEGGEVVAKREAGGWTLRGTKTCVPAAHVAACVLVPARIDRDGGDRSPVGVATAVFLLDPRTPGVKLERQVATTGEPWFRVSVDGVRLGDGDVLGPIERGDVVLDWLVPRATVALCAMQLGVAERALRMTAEYTSTRAQFDRPVATFQAVAQRAGDAYVDVEAIRVSTWQAAWRLANDLPAAREVAIAKYWACEGGHRVTYAAQHLHGGMGFDLEYPLHRYYLWAKQIESALGAAPVQLERLGAILAQPSIQSSCK
jgi:alkylation response protein AidB-like acyl-CoA dehydrogenase